MPELRKRPPPPSAPQPAKRGKQATSSSSSLTSKVKKAMTDVKDAVTAPVTNPSGPESDLPPTSTGTTTADAAATTGNTAEGTVTATGEAGVLPETTAIATSAGSTTAAADTTSTTTTATDPTVATPAPTELENPPEKGTISTSSNQTAPATATASTPLSASSVTQTLPLDKFAASIPTHTGPSHSLSSLLATLNPPDHLVLFTYPKASTPGCTTQACSFRDHAAPFTAAGLHIYGLSGDSPKANASFATKQNLGYPLLCDAEYKLIGPLGMKKPGNAKGTVRGVVVLSKQGVVKVWMQAGPARTVEAVEEFVAGLKKG